MGGLKYKNVKQVVDGKTFDSKREAKYYQDLVFLKRAGDVVDIDCHPKFVLQPAYWKCCKVVRTVPLSSKCPICGKKMKKTQAITYAADFRVTYADGRVEIVDVKGMETAAFKDKRKIWEYQNPELELKVIRRHQNESYSCRESRVSERRMDL